MEYRDRLEPVRDVPGVPVEEEDGPPPHSRRSSPCTPRRCTVWYTYEVYRGGGAGRYEPAVDLHAVGGGEENVLVGEADVARRGLERSGGKVEVGAFEDEEETAQTEYRDNDSREQLQCPYHAAPYLLPMYTS